ncbi:ROK family protein [Oceanimonas doudoroffii]|uniref:N-acetylglucosamine kinase n=1 Tax=Oceanimonas doudoroffii TaxID=84158 RepID=A0A233RF09_9GAMM|nr:ROK family protein [Oceanimonas doudoroffii]OXY81981.1 N-acetylglucosamine kinase [Oceanimonas doudoroffii]
MVYGLDIGGTKTAFGVFDEQFRPVETTQHPTPDSYDAFVGLVCALVLKADQRVGTRGRVGLGFPGVLNAEGRLLAPNVPAIHERDLLTDLQARLERPLTGDNDANCFLLSEYHGGAVAGSRLALGLTLGTGVGGALIQDGRLVNSRRGGSGEFGHGPIGAALLARHSNLPLFDCGCGLSGCLETYVSGTGLARLYRHCGGREQTGQAIITAWRRGEAEAVQAMTLYLEVLAAGLGALMTQLDPDAVVLGGGLGEAAWLYDELATRLPAHMMRGIAPAPLRPPVFGGAGGVRGAALLTSRPDSPFSSPA